VRELKRGDEVSARVKTTLIAAGIALSLGGGVMSAAAASLETIDPANASVSDTLAQFDRQQVATPSAVAGVNVQGVMTLPSTATDRNANAAALLGVGLLALGLASLGFAVVRR